MLAASSVQRGAPEAVQRRWHLGVQSSMSPADMMLEIFRALRVLQFEWKIVAQYSLKCRPCTARTASEGMGQEPMTRFKVKVGLQLYKIQEDSYLLDIRKADAAEAAKKAEEARLLQLLETLTEERIRFGITAESQAAASAEDGSGGGPALIARAAQKKRVATTLGTLWVELGSFRRGHASRRVIMHR
ncbi:hypothetical protein EMIHUDRAFT_246661 [Emiliania huxleyi CCMP1516]|uniref:AMPK C-terminal adenylate sensor domain-containing protein n=2 Tax=Emiliania huxleyi TaxID=2903 RepID=A0A0D3IR40_EMIH1|nr:hypothetical protein EMIHUDRAFT_246661 [Emiliania huxleyi CCMP1516]EOD13725.1 hypothetical protein EMIHUDRAFT_246661 [Emiliania huxleyi CCMP1516]|eukprot:XP_005766154.1 hypothetical protein EMIHUDRAFT_246661 [Emiliania huxleyi CCMP1516]